MELLRELKKECDNMRKIRVKKIDAASRQIDLAIRLSFSSEDAVGIHTLCAAGFRILRDIADKKGNVEMHEVHKQMIKPGKEAEFWKRVNLPANFFKHADKDSDPAVVYEGIDEEANDAMILWACIYYKDLGFHLTPEMKAFMLWFRALNPRVMDDEVVAEILEGSEFYRTLKSRPRSFQLAEGKRLLNKMKGE